MTQDIKIASAGVVPYSSVVGSSVMLLNAAGACVGQLGIVGVGDQAAQEAVAQRVADAINAEPLPYKGLRLAAIMALNDASDGYFSFGRAVAEKIHAPKGVTLAILRELRDEGLVVSSPVVDDDTGRPNGSGFALTAKGVAARVAGEDTQGEADE